MYRMPVAFGPAPGPRNVPAGHAGAAEAGKTTAASVSAATDPELLARHLPPQLSLRDDARIQVSVLALRELGWLAGRGYDVAMVTTPVVHHGVEEAVEGEFVLAMWESLADPVVTGREELGFPKLWANVRGPVLEGDACGCDAEWLGFRFLDVELADLREDDRPPPAPRPLLAHKYLPRSGEAEREQADVDYLTLDPPAAQRSLRRLRGSGRFCFHAARWEDMPTQYPVVQALAALPLADFHGRVEVAEGVSVGKYQRILR